MKILKKIIDDPQISKKALVKNILINCSSGSKLAKPDEIINTSVNEG